MFINEELFNSWIAEAIERQTKINSFVHSIDADIKVNISAYDDFYCIISDKLINVSLNSDPYTDQLLDSFIQNRFGVSMNPFLLGTLHEIGHIITFDKNLDRDRDILYYMLQLDYVDERVEELSYAYFSIPAEFEATKWAVNYYLSHKEYCDNFIKEIGL